LADKELAMHDKSKFNIMADLKEISAEELYNELNSSKRPVLVNALDPEAYLAKRIPGSINIPAEKENIIKSIVPDRDQKIVVYCANSDCNASPTLAGKLMDLNYENVYDFDAGLAGWQKQGYELSGTEA